jgi:hypothetical protein
MTIETDRGTAVRSTGGATGQRRVGAWFALRGLGDVPRAPVDSVVAAVKRDLARIAKADKELARGGLAMSALALARELDDQDNSATSKSMCAKALGEALEQLRSKVPERQEKDKLDELSDRRAKRLGRRATA